MQVKISVPSTHSFWQIFWKSDDYIFHAAALQKLFLLHKEQKKNFNKEEVSLRTHLKA
jgi:hypothetical protein